MTVKIEEIEGEPILIAWYLPPAGGAADMSEVNNLAEAMWKQWQRQIHVIADLSQLSVDFSSLVNGLGELRSDTAVRLMDKTVTYLVGTGKLVESLVSFTQQKQYGSRKMFVVSSVDEALQQARNAIAAEEY